MAKFLIVWGVMLSLCVAVILWPVVIGIGLLVLLFLVVTGGLAWNLSHLDDQ